MKITLTELKKMIRKQVRDSINESIFSKKTIFNDLKNVNSSVWAKNKTIQAKEDFPKFMEAVARELKIQKIDKHVTLNDWRDLTRKLNAAGYEWLVKAMQQLGYFRFPNSL
jgi:hypothetical protein